MGLLDESVFSAARLCVVGNINRDIKTAPIRGGDYLFRDGETPLSAIQETIGGGGANSAAIAASLGAHASFLGKIGADSLGQRLEQTMSCHGVKCHLRQAPELATGTTVNLNYEDGQRHFLSWQPNNAQLTIEDLEVGVLRDADHLLRADIWFSEPMLFGGNERLLRAARDLGVPASLDLNWDPQWGRAPAAAIARRKEAVRRLLPLADMVHGNARELGEFTEETELSRAVARLLEWGAGGVVAHLGAQGAGWFSQQECFIEPAAPVERPIAATGTGDVLSVCVMLLQHRKDLAMVEKLRFANRIVADFMEGRRKLIPQLV